VGNTKPQLKSSLR